MYHPEGNGSFSTPQNDRAAQGCRGQAALRPEVMPSRKSKRQGAKGSVLHISSLQLDKTALQLFLPDRGTTAGQINVWNKATQQKARIKIKKAAGMTKEERKMLNSGQLLGSGCGSSGLLVACLHDEYLNRCKALEQFWSSDGIQSKPEPEAAPPSSGAAQQLL